MVPFFPKTISNKGILFYVVSLIVVSLAFYNFAISVMWMLLGLTEVLIFFLLSTQLTKDWRILPSKMYEQNVFWVAFLLRVIWVIFSYFFYIKQTGQPFEFESADAIGYHEDAEWLATIPWSGVMNYLFTSRSAYSDSGYCLYLTFIYKIFGSGILIPRFLKALLSSYSCVLLYRLASRCVNEPVGRMTGIFAMLMPNLIVYCGLHLKETEMLFIAIAFMERADYMLRSEKFSFGALLLSLVLAGSLFLFRTLLGIVAVFSVVTALVFSPDRMIKKGRKVIVALWIVLAAGVLGGGAIMNEVEDLWHNRDINQEMKRMEQVSRGNQWAQYATGAVMAPVVFILPLASMVDTDQQNQLVLSGGNYVRNFMGIFVLMALVNVLFVKKNWRDFALIGSFIVAYLGSVSLSGFANSERFLLPGLPCLVILWSYGISIMNAKNYKWVKYWFLIVPLVEIGWAYFKVGSRGLLG